MLRNWKSIPFNSIFVIMGMKRPLLAFKLLLSMMMYSSTGFAEWTKVSKSVDGDRSIDFTVKYHNGMVYYWELSDYIKPTDHGVLSVVQYNQTL